MGCFTTERTVSTGRARGALLQGRAKKSRPWERAAIWGALQDGAFLAGTRTLSRCNGGKG
ncbi:hypothetical protein GCM10009552_32280 [Rothia nasimurium]